MASDKKRSQYNLLFMTIAIVAIVIIIGSNKSIFITNSSKNVSTSNSANQGGGDINTSTIVDTKPAKKIVYGIKGDSYFDIFSYNFQLGKSSKIFTDRDEEEKIIFAQSITKSGKILVMMSKSPDSFTGKLYLISTDGSGKKDKIIEDFGSPQAPIISPDGQKIAYILFSNAEKDFGFKLIVSNIDGSSKKQIVSDSTNLILYSWSPDSYQIVYIKGQENNIFTYNTTTNLEENLLVVGNDQINSLSWDKTDGILISKEPRGNNTFNQAEIFRFDATNKKLTQITSDSLYDDYPYYDGASNLVYISKNFDTKATNSSELGKIELWQNEKIAQIVDANIILGWID